MIFSNKKFNSSIENESLTNHVDYKSDSESSINSINCIQKDIDNINKTIIMRLGEDRLWEEYINFEYIKRKSLSDKEMTYVLFSHNDRNTNVDMAKLKESYMDDITCVISNDITNLKKDINMLTHKASSVYLTIEYKPFKKKINNKYNEIKLKTRKLIAYRSECIDSLVHKIGSKLYADIIKDNI